jgi:malonyl-CoA/methylmalonyl-CoA synthetase
MLTLSTTRYLCDAAATRAAHNEEGFFKTGDIARREGDNYFILGRASIDILKSGGYKLSALDIEREILGLPYVSEVMVVGVPDEEFGQRVGAVICLRKDQDLYEPDPDVGDDGATTTTTRPRRQLTLHDLRQDLRSRLAGYKLPTLLRVVRGELPKSMTGKVVKKVLGPQYFPEDYRRDCNVQVWTRGARM